MSTKFYAIATKSLLSNPYGKFTQTYKFTTRQAFVNFVIKHNGTLSQYVDGTGPQIVPHNIKLWAIGDGKIGYTFRIL